MKTWLIRIQWAFLYAGLAFFAACSSAPTTPAAKGTNPPLPAFQLAIITDCSAFDVAMNVFNALDNEGALNPNEKVAVGVAIGVENANCSGALPTTSSQTVTTAIQSIASAVSSLGSTQSEVVGTTAKGSTLNNLIAIAVETVPSLVQNVNQDISLYKSGAVDPAQLASDWANMQADISGQVAIWEKNNPGTVPGH